MDSSSLHCGWTQVAGAKWTKYYVFANGQLRYANALWNLSKAMSDSTLNPAEQAAEEAFAKVKRCIDERKSFLLEAGAGAGKTFSLVRALNYLIHAHGIDLLRKNQHIACITYTNVATDEIKTRTDRHAAIESATIHAFCWSIAKRFQLSLKNEIPNLKNWSERLEQAGGVGNRTIEYELGHPKVEEKRLLLHHNDVLALTVKLMENRKFLQLLA